MKKIFFALFFVFATVTIFAQNVRFADSSYVSTVQEILSGPEKNYLYLDDVTVCLTHDGISIGQQTYKSIEVIVDTDDQCILFIGENWTAVFRTKDRPVLYFHVRGQASVKHYLQ